MSLPDECIATLDIRLFGAFEVRLNGVLLPPMRVRKARWLLALLILHGDQAMERTWLSGLLWPESEERLALYSLRQRLNDLRHALGPEAHRLLAPTPRTLRFDLEGVFCDLRAFDLALRCHAETAQREAVRLYQGPLLEGCTESWVSPEREVREQMFLSALENLAQVEMDRKNYREAAVCWERVVRTDPLRESAQRGCMQALVADGDLAAAIQVYRDLRLLLHRELNATPDPETTALFQKIRQDASDRTQVQVAERPPVRPEATDVGSGRISPSRLPVPLTRFFGREEEIASLHRLLAPSATSPSVPRLLTLTGLGGSGKTRLAREVVESLKGEWSGGLWFVPLVSLHDASLIPEAIVDALGLHRTAHQNYQEQAIGFLNAQDGPVLLILDNFEHLLEKGTVWVRGLLEQVPALRLLVTSRQPLDLEGEQEFPVAPLPIPGAALPESSALEPLRQCASVALFVDRVQARRPDFRLTLDNAGAIWELCRRLEGIPLAIELAAGWARTQTPAQMVAQLAHRFAFLVSHRTDLPPRHLSLHAAIEGSYQALPAELQHFFCGLSVFRGGWTVEAAEAVWGEPRSQEYLEQLVERSLVQTEERGEVIRFGMLETLREFGWEHLIAGEKNGVQWRHQDYFLRMAEEARLALYSSEQPLWLERLQTEYDNIRAVLRFCAETPDSLDGVSHAAHLPPSEAGLRLCASLLRFWQVRGYVGEGRKWCATVLTHPGAEARTQARSRALSVAAGLAGLQDEDDLARSLQEEALAIAREVGDRLTIATSLNTLGILAWKRSEYVRARSLWEESLGVYRSLEDRVGISGAFHNLGLLAWNQGDYALAHSLWEESLAIRREIGDRLTIATSLNYLGMVARQQGDYGLARTLHEECLEITRKLDAKPNIASTLEMMGWISYDQGDYAQARTLWEESLLIRQELGNPLGVAGVFNCLAHLAWNQGDHVQARSLLKEGLTIYHKVGNVWGVAQLLELFAKLAIGEQEMERAARCWGAAEALRETMGAPLPPQDHAERNRHWAAAQQVLGSEAFEMAWAEGHTMNLEQAVAYALEPPSPSAPSEPYADQPRRTRA